jgi:hypothetical protein
MDDMKFYLGNNDIDEQHDDLSISEEIDEASIPTSFDWRTKNPACIGAVRSQLTCGSCWAFSSTSVLADRACIANKALAGAVLSPEDMVLCDTNNSGCNGGSLY